MRDDLPFRPWAVLSNADPVNVALKPAINAAPRWLEVYESALYDPLHASNMYRPIVYTLSDQRK